MEEVAGEAAVLVAPHDGAGLADALDAALDAPRPPGEDGSGADERRRRGLEIAARHTWAASAAVHLEAYRSALRSGRRPRG